MMATLPFTPVIIIGAGRSGTNILRDTLCRLPGFTTWPCDEINPVWRHGNLSVPHDQFGRDEARPAVVRFIRNAFIAQWKRSGRPAFVVEKTCASSLRVPFIDAILPEARYLYLVRSGLDVAASAGKRWQGQLEVAPLPYFLAKARFTPLTDLPLYGWRFLRSRLGMLTGQSQRLAFWGPRSQRMLTLDPQTPLPDLCAIQWADCVDASDTALAAIDPARWLALRYEDMVADPDATLLRIAAFLETDARPEAIQKATAPVSRQSVGKGVRTMTPAQLDRLTDLMSPVLARHGYASERPA